MLASFCTPLPYLSRESETRVNCSSSRLQFFFVSLLYTMRAVGVCICTYAPALLVYLHLIVFLFSVVVMNPLRRACVRTPHQSRPMWMPPAHLLTSKQRSRHRATK